MLGLISPVSSAHDPFSPASSVSGNLTEPRNYAPRTGPADDPPPKFDLSGVQGHVQQPGPGSQTLVRAYPDPDVENLAVVPADVQGSRSAELSNLTNTPSGLPVPAAAMDPNNFPFVEAPRMAQAINRGVVKLKNIPFATKRAEVVAFLGRNSRILNDGDSRWSCRARRA